ncbi:MAG: LptF/LptG family permease [Opitutaceae bacterium]|nr:LptF/LptG family permease [Opitutaceae bacterium]MBP9913586.1 LptF/LptG family permease [Opitutaceae bacterium]
MNLLDRYIFKSVLGSCLAAVGLFSFVLMLGNAIRDLLGYVLAGQLTPATFVWLIALLIPFTVSYALPMGMLTGVLLTLGRLSADSEITAMRAAGVSLFRIARPVVILGVLGAALGLYVNFSAMPQARLEYQRQLADAVRVNPLRFIVPRTFIRDFPGVVVYVGDKQGAVLKDFWLWQLDGERRVKQLIRAESGRFDYDVANNVLLLTLTHAQVESRNDRQPESFTESPIVGTFEKTEAIRLPLDKLFGRSGIQQKLKWMTYDQLMAEETRLARLTVPPEKMKEHRRSEMKVQLILQEKLQNALAMLTFALIGVPLGIKVSRRETSANLGVAVALALGYYFLTVMVNWLDRHPEYRPDLLFWIPNLLFLGLAVWLFRRIDRR